MGKSTISMAIFNSYVKFPEEIYVFPVKTSMTMWIYPLKMVIFNSYVSLPEGKRPGHLFSPADGRPGKKMSQPRDARSWCERERTSEFCAIETLQCGPPSDVCWLTKAPVTIVICVP